MSNHIETSWDLFSKTCLPLDCAQNKVKAFRGAFHAGAMAMFSLILEQTDKGLEPTHQLFNEIAIEFRTLFVESMLQSIVRQKEKAKQSCPENDQDSQMGAI